MFRTKLNVDGSINKHKAKLVGYSESDWGASLDDIKSTSGYFFSLGSGIFSRSSKKQEIVVQSTTKAKFIVLTIAGNQVLWLKKNLIDLNIEQKKSTKVFVDNQVAIAISHNPIFSCENKTF